MYSQNGSITDNHIEKMKTEKRNYDILQAQEEDLRDEKIDELEETYEKLSSITRKSVQHVVLDENLDKCFNILDEIQEV